MTRVAGEQSQHARRRRRPGALALAALVLLGLVALVSRGHAPGGGGGSTRHVNGNLILEYVVLFMLAVGLIVLPFVGNAWWNARHFRARARREKSWTTRLFMVVVPAGLFVAAFLLVRLLHRGSGSHGHGQQPIGIGSVASPGNRQAPPVAFDWLPAVVVGSLLVVGALVAVAIVRAGRPRPRPEDELAASLSDVLDDTLDDLRAEPDPRRAVVAAYARMERALAWFGVPRHAFEAPLEYLGRVLVELRASRESVRRLTGLFERARFSAHEIGPALKDDAIAALVTVRDELRGYR